MLQKNRLDSTTDFNVNFTLHVNAMFHPQMRAKLGLSLFYTQALYTIFRIFLELAYSFV